MTRNHLDASAILPAWAEEMAQDLEAGQPPLLVLGQGGLAADALPALCALASLDDQCTGLANPTALAGGDGSLWLLALLQRTRLVRPQAGGAAARQVQAIQAWMPPAFFTGPDPATHAAALNLAAQSLTPTAVDDAPHSQASPPPGLAWAIFPARSTGAMPPWAWLPWELRGSGAASGPGRAPAPVAAWTAYGGLLLALGLLLAGLLIR